MTTVRTPTHHLRIGLVVAAIFTTTFLAWSLLAKIQGAVVSTGELVYTDTREIDIRHGNGGPVAEVLVQSGSFVKAGDTLLRMNADLLMIEQRILQDRLFETRLREHRLQTLITDQPFLPLPSNLEVQNTTENTQRSVQREAAAHAASKAQIRAKIASLEDAQAQAKRAAQTAQKIANGLASEINIIEADLQTQTILLNKGLAQQSTLNSLERTKIQTTNEHNKAIAEVESQTARIKTLELERARIQAEYKAALIEELGKTAEIIPELEERLVGINAQMDRLEVRAPVSGHIHTLSVTTAGVVIPPGSVVATLVPDSGPAYVLTHIAPIHINQVYTGQKAMLRPLTRTRNNIAITAEVTRVGEGTRRDPITGKTYYEVLITPNLQPLIAKGDELVSGTPFEVAIQTQARSPMTYFLEPLLHSFRKALRE